MARRPGVARVFLPEIGDELILELVAPDKTRLDTLIMSEIQSTGLIASTRTLWGVNTLRWSRWGPATEGGVFVSTAHSELNFARDLADQITRDTGVKVWTMADLPTGHEQYQREINNVINDAPLHIFLIGRAWLASAECQAEFGRVEGLAMDRRDSCCIIIPDEVDFADLPPRIRQRQCLRRDDFFAYPKLMMWLSERLQRLTLP
jgi:hypothetical protein